MPTSSASETVSITATVIANGVPMAMIPPHASTWRQVSVLSGRAAVGTGQGSGQKPLEKGRRLQGRNFYPGFVFGEAARDLESAGHAN